MVVHGPDTRKFMQGLTTNNISQLYMNDGNQNPKMALYTLFLDPKGKVVSDAIVVRPQIYGNGKKIFAED
jgi:folate-binding Fe-S cluster repair protein YgfZ